MAPAHSSMCLFFVAATSSVKGDSVFPGLSIENILSFSTRATALAASTLAHAQLSLSHLPVYFIDAPSFSSSQTMEAQSAL